MRSMLFRLISAFILTAAIAGPVHAQGSFFTSLSGAVVDVQGGVIPGADVKVKNTGTGIENNAVTGADGTFTIPSLPGGTYSVTVTLQGFKTVTLSSVTLNAAVPANVKVTLQVGALEENVTVTGDSALVVQTQTPSIATNLTGAQITSLPLTSRNALDSLTSLPGFNTSGTARNSTVNGLPKSAVNITLDGMSIQDNYNKTTDGYLRAVDADARLGRGSHRDNGGKYRGFDRTGRCADQVRDQVREQQLERHRVRVFPPRCVEREHVVQQPRPAAGSDYGQGAEDPAQTLPAGNRPGRADRTQPSVLLLQLRGRAATEPGDAEPECPHTRSSGRPLQLQRRGRGAPGQPVAARGGERPARDAGSDRVEGARRHHRRDEDHRQPDSAQQSDRSTVHVPDEDRQFQPGAHGPSGLRRVAEPSPDRVDELSPHQFDPRHDQQRLPAVSGIRPDGQPAVVAMDDVRVAAVDVQNRTW